MDCIEWSDSRVGEAIKYEWPIHPNHSQLLFTFVGIAVLLFDPHVQPVADEFTVPAMLDSSAVSIVEAVAF